MVASRTPMLGTTHCRSAVTQRTPTRTKTIGTAQRLTPSNLVSSFAVELEAGTEYFLTSWAGGGGTQTDPTITIRPAAMQPALVDLTAADVKIVDLAAIADRQLITTSNPTQSGFGIATSAFHLSEDPATVGTQGQTVTLTPGTPKDLYLVGASSDGPGGAGIEHNGTVNSVHLQAVLDGTEITWTALSVVRHHPGPGDWATRTYDSVIAAGAAHTLASFDYDLLVDTIQPVDSNAATADQLTVAERAVGVMRLTNDQTIDTELGQIAMTTGGSDKGVYPFNEASVVAGGMVVTPGTFVDDTAASQTVDGTNDTSSMVVPRDGLYRYTLLVPSALDSTVQNNDRPLASVAVNGAVIEVFNVNDLSSSGNDDQDKHVTTLLTLSAGDMVQACYVIEGGETEQWFYRPHIESSGIDGAAVTYSSFTLEEITNVVVSGEAAPAEFPRPIFRYEAGNTAVNNSDHVTGVPLSEVDFYKFIYTQDGTNDNNAVATAEVDRVALQITGRVRLDTFASGYSAVDVIDDATGEFRVADTTVNVNLVAIEGWIRPLP